MKGDCCMNMTDSQIERYSRHIILPQIGGEGQIKLLSSKILIIGAGGLGCPAGFYLSAAGVGTIGLIDSDVVDISNLQRQIAHTTNDIGRPKVISAGDKFKAINPDVTVKAYHERFGTENALEILKDYDFIIDGTDNFVSKFFIADACHFAGKPYSHAGILRFSGQMMTVKPGETACYRCIFNAPPPPGAVPTCSQAGVLGAVAGVIGCLQAAEALKFLLNIGETLFNRLLIYDALETRFREVRLKRQPDCPLCGNQPTITELREENMIVCSERRKQCCC